LKVLLLTIIFIDEILRSQINIDVLTILLMSILRISVYSETNSVVFPKRKNEWKKQQHIYIDANKGDKLQFYSTATLLAYF